MSEDNILGGVIGWSIFLMVVFFVLGIYVDNKVSTDYWQTETVKKGFAQYSPQTGQWEWKQ